MAHWILPPEYNAQLLDWGLVDIFRLTVEECFFEENRTGGRLKKFIKAAGIIGGGVDGARTPPIASSAMEHPFPSLLHSGGRRGKKEEEERKSKQKRGEKEVSPSSHSRLHLPQGCGWAQDFCGGRRTRAVALPRCARGGW
jgi:hypothetical protein